MLHLIQLTGPLPAFAGAAYVFAGLLLLAALAASVALRGPFPPDPAARALVIARGAVVLSAALLAVLSPHYPWYFTMIAFPAVVFPSWSALWLTITAPLLYLDKLHQDVLWPAFVFVPALLLLAYDLAVPSTPIPTSPTITSTNGAA